MMFKRNFAAGKKDGALKPVYDAVMKNNTTYIFTIVAAAAVAGVGFNGAVDMMWETANRGKLYHHVDWSRFKEEDEDDDHVHHARHRTQRDERHAIVAGA